MNRKLSSVFTLLAAVSLFGASPRASAQTGWGKALSFDGTNDSVKASGIMLSNSSLTIELWARRTTFSMWNPFVTQGWDAVSNGLYFTFMGSQVLFGYYGQELVTAQSLSDANWHHWAATHNQTTGERCIYQDGRIVATDTNWGDFTGSGDLWIGVMPWSAPDYFGGQMDEVRVWNVSRSADQIRQHLYRRLTGQEANLLGYWKFDEGAGNTAYDSTTNGHNGILNGPQWMDSTIPPWGRALSFDGADDYVSVDFPELANNYTVSAWVFLRAGGDYWGKRAGVLSSIFCDTSAEVLIHNLSDASAPQHLWLGRCGAYDGTPSTSTVPLNQWVHMAVTVSPTRQVSYFINGRAAGSWDADQFNVAIGPSITLGDNTAREFDGILDDFRVWNKARTEAEIQSDMSYPLTGLESNLIAYWSFNEGDGTTAYEGTTNGHNGILNDGPDWTNSTIPPVIELITLSAGGLAGLGGSASLNSAVNPGGFPTTVWFEWGTDASFGATTPATNLASGFNPVAVSSQLSGLDIGTAYHYRAVASNRVGVTYGVDRTFTILAVTALADSDTGSLRETIANAANGDILFITNSGTIYLSSGDLYIDKDLSIVGPGAADISISAEHSSIRAFNIRSNVIVRISGLTIWECSAPWGSTGSTPGAAGGAGKHGGGIYNAGQLTLTDCVLSNNYAGEGGSGASGVDKGVGGGNGGNGGNGGSGGGGGGIYNAPSGWLWVDRCTIVNNRSGWGGQGGRGGQGGDSEGVPGAGGNGGNGGSSGSGGGVLNDGWATLKNCTVSGNQAARGGHFFGGGGAGGDNLPVLGIYWHWGGNGGAGGWGGFGGSGGGVAGNGHTILINCTISGNRAGYGGLGGYGGDGGFSSFPASPGHVGGGGRGGNGGTGGGIHTTGSLELRNCTIAHNVMGDLGPGGPPGASGTPGGLRGSDGDYGETGGIHNAGAQSPSVGNTVVAYNVGAFINDDVSGSFVSQGYNLVGTIGTSIGFGMPGDLWEIDPLLRPLADNGGPTATHEPQTISPLINSGSNRGAPATDQRGLPRVAGGTIDIGACEIQSPASMISYAWLQGYGLPTDGSADYLDTDGDLMNNWNEWQCGTAPIDSQSVLRMLPLSADESGVVVSWESVSGMQYWTRRYFLQRSTNLGATPPFVTLATNLLTQGATTSYIDTNAVGTMHFYRVGVQE